MRKSETFEIDRLDYRILAILSEQGRCSDVAMGERIGLSSNAVARRRKLLEENQIISSYAAQLDLDRMGHGILILVQIELISQAEEALQIFERAIRGCSAVSKCWFLSGDTDFMALVHVPSLRHYDETYRQQFSSLPNVSRIRSSFALRTVVDRPTAPSVLREPDLLR